MLGTTAERHLISIESMTTPQVHKWGMCYSGLDMGMYSRLPFYSGDEVQYSLGLSAGSQEGSTGGAGARLLAFHVIVALFSAHT